MILRVTGVLLALLTLSIGVRAQQMTGAWSVRAGYYLGNQFSIGAPQGQLEGLVIGIDAPLVRRIPFAGALSLSVDVALGGTARSGGDSDGNIYRFLLTLRREVGSTPYYAGFGLGYAFTDSRGNQFPDVRRFATQYLLGYRFPVGVQGRLQPVLEVSFQEGGDNRLNGWMFQAGVRF